MPPRLRNWLEIIGFIAVVAVIWLLLPEPARAAALSSA